MSDARHLQVVHLQRAAPAKPAVGAPCNGCGVCCAAEPCPVGMLLFRQRHGPCPALIWQAAEARYRCGLLCAPARHLRWLPRAADRFAARLFARWIAAGAGCDSTVEIG